MGVFLLNDLKLYYKLDELGVGDVRVDSGPNSLDLSVVGTGVNVEVGLLGNATRGTQNPSNYLSAAHNNIFRAAGDMTISAFVKVPAGTFTINHGILGHFATTGNQRGWLLYGRNAVDSFTFEASSDGINPVRAVWGSTYVADVWYHVVGVVDTANNRIGISVDRGAFVYTAFTPPVFAATTALVHQALESGGILSGAAWIDELGVWDRLLNTDELNTLEGSGTPPSFSTFVASGGDSAPAFFFFHNREV